MSFNLQSFLDDAEKAAEFDFSSACFNVSRSEREESVIRAVETAVKDILAALGGHVSASAAGHVSPLPAPGDNLSISVTFVPKPADTLPPDPPAEPAVQEVPIPAEQPPAEAPVAPPVAAEAPVQTQTVEPQTSPDDTFGGPGAFGGEPAQPVVPDQAHTSPADPPSTVADAEVVPLDTSPTDLPVETPQEAQPTQPSPPSGPTPVFSPPEGGWPTPGQ